MNRKTKQIREASASRAFGLVGAAIVVAAIVIPSMSAAAPVVQACGAPINSVVTTETSLFAALSTSFVNIAGAAQVITVPPGATRCVKLRFSTVAAVGAGPGTNACVMRAASNIGGVFHPASGETYLAVNQTSRAAHSFEWVKRLGPGTHVLRMQAKVQTLGTACSIGPWTLATEVTQ